MKSLWRHQAQSKIFMNEGSLREQTERIVSSVVNAPGFINRKHKEANLEVALLLKSVHHLLQLFGGYYAGLVLLSLFVDILYPKIILKQYTPRMSAPINTQGDAARTDLFVAVILDRSIKVCPALFDEFYQLLGTFVRRKSRYQGVDHFVFSGRDGHTANLEVLKTPIIHGGKH